MSDFGVIQGFVCPITQQEGAPEFDRDLFAMEADGTPRLYEMMFGSAPGFNWLPLCDLPVNDWDSDEAQARFAWLKRWSGFYRAIAKSEMTSHAFLSGDREQQRVEFANGVTAEFDMAQDLCRVQGVDGFSGDWEKPADDLGWYPCVQGEFDGVTWKPLGV